MYHIHTDTLEYEGKKVTRAFRHSHLIKYEAHTHQHSWEGESRNETQQLVMKGNITEVTTSTKKVF